MKLSFLHRLILSMSVLGKRSLAQDLRNDILLNHSEYLESLMASQSNTSIYEDLGNNLDSRVRYNGVVEVLVVMDKYLGDIFSHDRQKVLDYLTVYFWDVNMRFKTIRGVNLSLRVTGVHVFSELDDQRFIEEARHYPSRLIDFTKALNGFNAWLNNHQNSIPQFDVAVLMTHSADQDRLLGRATDIGNACKNSGVILQDDGAWKSVFVATHEIGHMVGAYHDDEPLFPSKCGYYPHNIMASGNNNTRKLPWYFSQCSGKQIRTFFRSSIGECIHRIDEQSISPLSPEFEGVTFPSMTELCQLSLRNPSAFVLEEDTGDCEMLRCSVSIGSLLESYSMRLPLDNTPCSGGGHCFRKPGFLIVNVYYGDCIHTVNEFNSKSSVAMHTCPKNMSGSPLDRFLIGGPTQGLTLSVPYHIDGGKESGEACLIRKPGREGVVSTRPCLSDGESNKREFLNDGGDEFRLRHLETQKCARQTGNKIRVDSSCGKSDLNMKWKLM